jgi:hypothetical protein
MPWKIVPKGDKFEVVEEAPGPHPGKVFGTHATKDDAQEQLKALYAAVPESKRSAGANEDHLFRFTRADSDTADPDDKTIQVAFSSEALVLRTAREAQEKLGISKKGEKYWELLSHRKTDADFSELNTGKAAVLDEHNDSLQIGNVKRAKLSKDKIGRAVLQFDGLSELSNTRFAQMESGKRDGISTGYWHTRFIGDEGTKDGHPIKRIAWAADEISSTRTPADDEKSGVRRSRMFRSADGKWACLTCGNMFTRSELDEDFECGCEKRSLQNERFYRSKTKDGEMTISHRELHAKVFDALNNDKRFKSKRDNGDTNSYFRVLDIKQIVGDGDNDDWQAHVESPAWRTYSKNYLVDFTYDGTNVVLGESQEVEPKITLEPVQRCLTLDGRLVRSSDGPYGDVEYADSGLQKDGKKRYPINTKEHAKAAWSYINQKHNADKYSAEDLAKVKSKIKAACKKFGVEISDEERSTVDLQKLTRADDTANHNLQNKVMAKTVAELQTEVPELVASIQNTARSEAEKTTRKAVMDEVHQSAEKRGGKIGEQLKEIRTLADAYCKDSGKNWAGPDGAVVVVADEIRKLERKAYDDITALKDDDTFNSEAGTIRNKFKTDAGELVRNSYAPREMREAGTLDNNLAEKVSLKRLWDKANECFERGDQRKCFMLADGAEFEADKELRNISGKFPGGLGYSPEGQLFPLNARGHIIPSLRQILRKVDERRANGERLTRDSLLSDFPSLGALVPPEYMTPIELLRNKLVLVGNGLMEVHGVVGNPLTFPRLSAPTQAQSLAEGVALNTYDQTFDQVKLTPHRVGTAQKYSRLGMSQAPGFEAVVWDDHARVAALYINRGLINGPGGGDDVLGILNYVGINGLAFGGSAANAWKNIFGPGGLVTLIRKANIDDDITLLSTSVGAGTLRTTAAAVVGATAYGVGPLAAILQGDSIGGKDFEESQQIPADILLAVAARHIILATWAGLNVVLDTVQFADQDKFRLVTNQYYDVGLRHSQAVSRSVDNISALA